MAHLSDKVKNLWQRAAAPLIAATPKQRLKWLVLTTVFSAAAVAAEVAFYEHYRFAWDRQMLKCLDVNVLLVDLKDKELKRDQIYAYTSKQAAPVIPEGKLMGKYLRGLPGDTVEIKTDDSIWVNGVKVAQGMPQLRGMNPMNAAKFYGKRVLKDDEYWMMGTKPLSFDSRYWGPIHKDQIYGRAYALF